jgi:predicted amidohydrolase YtcJ
MQTHRCIGLDLFKALEVAAILGLLVLSGHAAQVGEPIKWEPDYILVNGKILTADATKHYAQALAIRGERIVSVGTSEEVGRLASPHTIRIDLHGHLVIPGINDAHYHFLPRPVAYQLSLKGQEPTCDEVKKAVAAAVHSTPPGTLINGVIGLSMLDEREANRTTLDHLAPDHPVQLACYWGHCSLFNSAFMRKVGIEDKEPDPPGGIYPRDAEGRITGRSIEYANFRLHAKLQELTPEQVQLQDAKHMLNEAAHFGVTTIQVMAIGCRDETAVLLRKAKSPIRIRIIDFSVSAPDHPLPPPVVQNRQNVYISGLKWVLDGEPVLRTAALRQHYIDGRKESGHLNFSQAQMEVILRESLRQKQQLLVHVVGDDTIEHFFAGMMVTGGPAVWSRRRVRLEHGEGLLPDLVQQAKDLGVIVVQNPTDFALGDLFVTRYGKERAAINQPFGSLLRAGIPLAIGSDGQTTTPDLPMEDTFRADTEMNPYLNIMFATHDPFRPEESITREQAVIAYTLTSAYAEFAEKEKGSLEPDKLADLAVLSQDLFEVPATDLPKMESLLTMVGGKIVYNHLTE